MQIRTPPLIIALLAAGLWLSAAIGQQSGSVNVRSGAACPQPNVSDVRVNVNRNRVPLGELVTFSIAPPSVPGDPRFTVTIYFGDFPNSKRVMGKEPVSHLYTATGIYTYGVCVAPAKPPFPSVKLIANPTTVATNALVNFTAQVSQSYPNIKYRFVFADGSQTDWQDATQTSHGYAAAKTYLAYVDIGEASGGSVRRIGGSPRQRIQVISPPAVRAELLAKPASVKAGETVSFRAQTNSGDPQIKYRFAFGDGATTGWQDNPRAEHKYAVAKDYFASLEVGLPSGQGVKTITTSKPAKINVAARSNPKPLPSPFPSPEATPIAGVGATSPTATPTIKGPPDSSNDLWKYLLALLAIFLGYKAARYFLVPRPKFVPNLDPGASRVGAGKPLSIDLQLALNPNLTGGQYELETHEGSLIKAERGSNG